MSKVICFIILWNDQVSKIRVSTFAVGHCIKPFLPEGIKMFWSMLFLKSWLGLLCVTLPIDNLTKIPFAWLDQLSADAHLRRGITCERGLWICNWGNSKNLDYISLECWPLLAIQSNLIRLTLWVMLHNVNLLKQIRTSQNIPIFTPVSLLAML